MSAIAKYLEAADRRPAVDVTELGHAARNAAHEVRELVELCREFFINECHAGKKMTTADRIRELVR